MREGDSILIEKYENRISYLENKLKNILNTIENVIDEDIEKAKKSLTKYKESTESIVLGSLIEKSAAPTPQEDKTLQFLKIVLEIMPFPVFMKDETGTYLMINSLEADLFGVGEAGIIGKHDRDFIKNKEELDIIEKSDNEVLTKKQHIELPNQSFTLSDGRSYIFKTHKIHFVNPLTGRSNILGFSVDITDTVSLDKLLKVVSLCNSPYL